jgi:predicted DNA binding CopG/RHH family protein
MDKVEVIRDFLPPPEELAFREDGVKVTLSLSPKSVAFFKNQARTYKSPYQRMIRRLIDLYVEQHS